MVTSDEFDDLVERVRRLELQLAEPPPTISAKFAVLRMAIGSHQDPEVRRHGLETLRAVEAFTRPMAARLDAADLIRIADSVGP